MPTLAGAEPVAFERPEVALIEVQRRPGSAWIDVTFRLLSGSSVWVVLEASADSGATWDVPVISVIGDVGHIQPGPEEPLHVAWDKDRNHRARFYEYL